LPIPRLVKGVVDWKTGKRSWREICFIF